MEKEIAIGMYTVHESASADMPSTFRQLREMGYTGIEFFGEPEIDPVFIRQVLANSGLTMTGWHIEWMHLQPTTIGRTLRYLERIECPAAVIPCLGGRWNVAHTQQQECRDAWMRHIEWMNHVCVPLRAHGIRLGYHNHEHEFLLRYDDQSVFDLLFQALDPDIIMELDTGNCIEGGSDPAMVIERFPARDLFLHMKPFSSKQGFDVTLGDGSDENHWCSILHAAQSRCLQWIVESESVQFPELQNAQLCLDGFRRFYAFC